MKSNTTNAYASDTTTSSSDTNSPSPPPSPPRLSTISQCRRRLRSKPLSFSKGKNIGAGINLRRKLRYLLMLPLLYVISGLFVCVGPFSGLLGFYASVPGSVYRSHENFERLWDEIRFDNSSAIEYYLNFCRKNEIMDIMLQLSSVWKYKRRLKVQKPCPNATAVNRHPMIKEASGPSTYLIIVANGGLNQQRSAICNAVAVAGLLNATLVIPWFEFNSIWKDPSDFGDLYDEDHFISSLKGYVNVVKELPDTLMEKYDYNITNIPTFRVQAWAPVNYYLGVVYPLLRSEGVIRIVPFANRLAMHVPPYIQMLRCLANYRALRFSSPISILAEKLVRMMIDRSQRTAGLYVSIHLRFEEDMVAFSCCLYDGGEAENFELKSFRERGWKGKFKIKGHATIPSLNRIEGKCPLTPVEVGLMLRGMGFDNNTSIYLASGKIYRAEKHLAPLKKMFPLLYTKESLASPEELAPFEGYSSRLAAIDYAVSLLSEVFVTTQGGNFPHFLMGHRRFLFGHAKTIIPDKRKLVVLLEDMGIRWKAFKNQMDVMLTESDRKGMMVPRVKRINRKTSIYAYPLPECSCLQRPHNSSLDLTV